MVRRARAGGALPTWGMHRARIPQLVICEGVSVCVSIAFDRCQWQWCERTSGFESNPILASSFDGTSLASP